MKSKLKKGFTLIEVLLVVAILAILAGIVIIAVNPQKQLQDANVTQRKADVNTILDAVYQYAVDNKGAMPGSNIPTTPTAASEICTSAVSATCTTASLADLSSLISSQTYLTAIPVDPAGENVTSGAGYTIQKSSNGRITITAPAVGGYGAYSATR
jgi:type IV pilus assembly protein PilA